jgi:ribosomal protein S18 acetylase RimI-like enzyme
MRAPAAAPRWRRAVRADLPALADFLRADEERRVGFSGRLIRDEDGRGPALHLPTPLRGAVWILDADAADGAASPSAPSIAGAVLCHPSRLAFPVFPEGTEGDRSLGLLAASFAPASVIGMARDVARYESVFGLAPRASVAYRLMTPGSGAAGPGGEAAVPPRAYPGLSLRRAALSDLEALMYLQEAYEREEVLTPVHEFNRAACRASLARTLERQLVFAAEEGGVLIGKAGTNARGFRVDQVGGVYTLPERRGRGVASALMALLLAEIRASGKAPALFVKPGNAPARALYRGLGFEDLGDYRADYFEP